MDRFWHGVSLLLGGLIGAAGCDSKEYGIGMDSDSEVPASVPLVGHTYKLWGRVRQADNDAYIEGIEVSFEAYRSTTSSRGAYTLNAHTGTDCTSGCQIKARDTDGTDNGGQFAASSAAFTSDGGKNTHSFERTIKMEPVSR